MSSRLGVVFVSSESQVMEISKDRNEGYSRQKWTQRSACIRGRRYDVISWFVFFSNTCIYRNMIQVNKGMCTKVNL